MNVSYDDYAKRVLQCDAVNCKGHDILQWCSFAVVNALLSPEAQDVDEMAASFVTALEKGWVDVGWPVSSTDVRYFKKVLSNPIEF